MCGISGKITYDGAKVTEDQIARMCRALDHRGPDDKGVYLNQISDPKGRPIHIGLGHTRLSIIDLSKAGHQPMCNEDGTVWIVFNGEIYNFKPKRADLKRKGHQFRSDSDTEVILHLYEEEGIGAARHLNGMFAFAIWDEKIPRLWLCRDRLGIKPLVYSWNGRKLVFASEIKSLLQLPEIGRQMNRQALELYLAFNYVPAPYTLFQDINKLEPGYSLVVEDGSIQLKRYWDLRGQTAASRIPAKDQFISYKNALQEALSEAVRSHMIADVPLGAFLSGGIDSSIVVAVMAKHAGQPIKTFSIGFTDDALYDETRYSREVAKMYQTDHHEFKISERDMLDVLPSVLASFDEPFADSSAIPTYLVSLYTRRHVKAALSGDGGDELFAGYRSYLGEFWHPWYMMIPKMIRRKIEKIIQGMPDSRDTRWMDYIRRAKKFLNAAGLDYPKRLLALKEVIPGHLRSMLFIDSQNGSQAKQSTIAQEWVNLLIDRHQNDRINTMLYTDLADSLPGDMLNKVDWMSMQHGLEVRVPFLDHRVVELAFEIPGDFKIKGFTTKYILKEAFRHVLPKSLMNRPKSGFELPLSRWLKTDLKFLIADYLSKKRIESQGIFDCNTIERMKKDFLQNRTDTAWMLWNLIVFEYWYDGYMKTRA